MLPELAESGRIVCWAYDDWLRGLLRRMLLSEGIKMSWTNYRSL